MIFKLLETLFLGVRDLWMNFKLVIIVVGGFLFFPPCMNTRFRQSGAPIKTAPVMSNHKPLSPPDAAPLLAWVTHTFHIDAIFTTIVRFG